MIAVRWASGFLTVLCLALVVVRLRADGVLVLATVFAVAFVWSLDAFRASFWSGVRDRERG